MSAAESNPAAEAPSPAAGGLKKGPWTAAEDAILIDYVKKYGEGNWNAVQRNTGLSRCGKSCRLRWANHLRPNLKKGSFSPDEERLILELHSKMGNKWARMAAQLPGRTDNEIKNYWNTRIKRRQRAGLPLYPPELQRQTVFRHRPAVQFAEQKPQFAGDFSLFEIPEPSASVFFQPPAVAYAPAPPPIFQFNSLGNYDLDPLQQSFSMKMELPSNQLFPEMNSVNSGGDLLDSLLRERDDHHQNLYHYQLNFNVPEHLEEKICGGKVKIERDQEISIDDDLSALLGAIPAAAMTSAGESNGQSSAVTDVGLEMQQATSSISIAGGKNLGWSIMHRHPLV